MPQIGEQDVVHGQVSRRFAKATGLLGGVVFGDVFGDESAVGFLALRASVRPEQVVFIVDRDTGLAAGVFSVRRDTHCRRLLRK